MILENTGHMDKVGSDIRTVVAPADIPSCSKHFSNSVNLVQMVEGQESLLPVA